MLADAGYEVIVEIVSNNQIRSFQDKLKAAVRVGYNPTRERWVENLLDQIQPDVVHVHNFFPLLTFAVHTAAHRRGVAVVQTLHNYRLLCAKGTFERGQDVCELCLGHSNLPALRYKCYRNSFAGSLAVMQMQLSAKRKNRLANNVDRFIALTEFARGKFIEGGLPPEKIAVKPNFIDRPNRPIFDSERDGALFIGRLSKEKGVFDLIDAWRGISDIPLTIAGDGPARAELEHRATPNVRFLGQISSEEVERRMRCARVLVIPSIWYEGFPVTLVEAFSNALPVIATRIGSLAEIVKEGRNGLLVEPRNSLSLREAVIRLFNDVDAWTAMSIAARSDYEEYYTKSRNLNLLLEIYESAIRQALFHIKGAHPNQTVEEGHF